MDEHEPLFNDAELDRMYKHSELIQIPSLKSHYGSIMALRNNRGMLVRVARVYYDYAGQSKGQIFLKDTLESGVQVQGISRQTIDNLLSGIYTDAVKIYKGALYTDNTPLVIQALRAISEFISEKERIPSIGELR